MTTIKPLVDQFQSYTNEANRQNQSSPELISIHAQLTSQEIDDLELAFILKEVLEADDAAYARELQLQYDMEYALSLQQEADDALYAFNLQAEELVGCIRDMGF